MKKKKKGIMAVTTAQRLRCLKRILSIACPALSIFLRAGHVPVRRAEARGTQKLSTAPWELATQERKERQAYSSTGQSAKSVAARQEGM